MKTHLHRDEMSTEINRLKFVQACRKRAAEEPTESLRRIFNSSGTAGSSVTVGFDELESSMYKRRKVHLPPIYQLVLI